MMVPTSRHYCRQHGVLRLPAPAVCIAFLLLLATGIIHPSIVVADFTGFEPYISPSTPSPALERVNQLVRSCSSKDMSSRRLEDDNNLSGVYMYENEKGETVGVFKPCYEELGAPGNNANRDLGVMVGDFRPGESARREAAAFWLDKDGHGWAGVPTTVLVSAPSSTASSGSDVSNKFKRIGSLQEFCSNCRSLDTDKDPFNFRDTLERMENLNSAIVHKVGVLDIRLNNCDRHSGNLLFKNVDSLTPIDHGNVLPRNLKNFEPKESFSALFWDFQRQMEEPFAEGMLTYINHITDVEILLEDGEVLRSEPYRISSSSILMYWASSTLLRVAALKLKLSLYEICVIMQGLNDHVIRKIEEKWGDPTHAEHVGEQNPEMCDGDIDERPYVFGREEKRKEVLNDLDNFVTAWLTPLSQKA